jgi:hypothetical protein
VRSVLPYSTVLQLVHGSSILTFHLDLRGRTLSLDFLRRPSKRLYPDYYKLIQRPIALEEIKKQLDRGAYPSLEALKSDFELCFLNAKQYNMKDSEIWRDAKDLLVSISTP